MFVCFTVFLIDVFLVFRIEPDTSHLIVIRMQGHKRAGKEGKKEKGRKAERQAGRKEGREKEREEGRERCVIMPAEHSFIHSAIFLVVVSLEITLSFS